MPVASSAKRYILNDSAHELWVRVAPFTTRTERIAIAVLFVPFFLAMPLLGVGMLYHAFYEETESIGLAIFFGFFLMVGAFGMCVFILFYQLRKPYELHSLRLSRTSGTATFASRRGHWQVEVPLAELSHAEAVVRVLRRGKGGGPTPHLLLHLKGGSYQVLDTTLTPDQAQELAQRITQFLQAPGASGPSGPLPVGCGVWVQPQAGGTLVQWRPLRHWGWLLFATFALAFAIGGAMGVDTASTHVTQGVWIVLAAAGAAGTVYGLVRHIRLGKRQAQLLANAQGVAYMRMAHPNAPALDAQALPASACNALVLLPERENQSDLGGLLLGTPETVWPVAQHNFYRHDKLQLLHQYPLRNFPGIVGIRFDGQPLLLPLQVWAVLRGLRLHAGHTWHPDPFTQLEAEQQAETAETYLGGEDEHESE